jgi:nucleoside-diphosphate-sugar epimerase
MTTIPVLVTGANGYLGQRIIVALEAAGLPCIAVTHSGGQFSCDLGDAGAVRDLLRRTAARTLIHCAAQVPANETQFRDDALAQQSISMVKNLVAAAPAHIVFTSTMTVYRNPARLPVREEDAATGLEGYTAGKLAAERLLLDAPELRTTILRLPGLFGAPRRNGLLYNAALAMAAGRRPSTPATPPLWTTMHVDDAAAMCVRAARRATPGSALLNCAYPVRTSVESVLRELADLIGAPPPVVPGAPMFEMDIGRLVGELGAPAGNLHDRLRELAELARRDAQIQLTKVENHD